MNLLWGGESVRNITKPVRTIEYVIKRVVTNYILYCSLIKLNASLYVVRRLKTYTKYGGLSVLILSLVYSVFMDMVLLGCYHV